jgi:hypothetical protein
VLSCCVCPPAVGFYIATLILSGGCFAYDKHMKKRRSAISEALRGEEELALNSIKPGSYGTTPMSSKRL